MSETTELKLQEALGTHEKPAAGVVQQAADAVSGLAANLAGKLGMSGDSAAPASSCEYCDTHH